MQAEKKLLAKPGGEIIWTYRNSFPCVSVMVKCPEGPIPLFTGEEGPGIPNQNFNCSMFNVPSQTEYTYCI